MSVPRECQASEDMVKPGKNARKWNNAWIEMQEDHLGVKGVTS